MTGTKRGLESTPLVIDGVLYATGSWSRVYALDATSGRELWRFDPEVPGWKGRNVCCDVVNRGVAAWKGRIYLGTIDGRLIALDAATGKPDWEVQTTDPGQPYSITGAPRVVKGRVIIGNGGADLGVRSSGLYPDLRKSSRAVHDSWERNRAGGLTPGWRNGELRRPPDREASPADPRLRPRPQPSRARTARAGRPLDRALRVHPGCLGRRTDRAQPLPDTAAAWPALDRTPRPAHYPAERLEAGAGSSDATADVACRPKVRDRIPSILCGPTHPAPPASRTPDFAELKVGVKTRGDPARGQLEARSIPSDLRFPRRSWPAAMKGPLGLQARSGVCGS